MAIKPKEGGLVQRAHDARKNSSTIALVDGHMRGFTKAVTGFFIKLLAEFDGKNLFKMAHVGLHHVAPKCAGFNQYRTVVALPVVLYNGLFDLVRGREGPILLLPFAHNYVAQVAIHQ